MCVCACVCVRVFVCVREREGGRERVFENKKKSIRLYFRHRDNDGVKKRG